MRTLWYQYWIDTKLDQNVIKIMLSKFEQMWIKMWWKPWECLHKNNKQACNNILKFDSEFPCPIASTCMEFGSNFSIQKEVSQIKEKT